MPRTPLRIPLRLLALSPALLLAVSCASSPPRSHPITSEEALADFETAWKAIDETYYDREFNGVDWPAIHDEYLPRAEAATDMREIREVIGEMLGRLGQSHFAVIPQEALPPSTEGEEGETPDAIAGGCGLDVRLREGRLLVTRVKANGPADRAGIETGWVLLEVDGEGADEVLSRFEAAAEELGERGVAMRMREVFRRQTYGEVGSTAELAFLDGDDREIRLEVVREERDVIRHDAADTLPPFYLEFDSDIRKVNGRSVGIIHFSNWFLPMSLKVDEAIDGMRACDGIVLDLRGNGGGAGAMCMGLAGHFFDERRQVGTMQMKDATMKFTANPRRVSPGKQPVQPLDVPLAIVIDEGSGSASEIFAGGMQSVGRARVFGETSAGAVLAARMTTLPSGDALLHAMADFETADGTRLEHRGVIPDEPIPVTREDLIAGRDAQLEGALEWVSTR